MGIKLIPEFQSPTAGGTSQGPSCPTIAILGGGFSGSMVAVELLRRACGRVSVVLIERRSVPGRGLAYSTQFEGHLLNVRAKNMSAYASVPNHFVQWAQRHYSSSVKPDDFLPRTIYGQYVSSQLREMITHSRGSFRCIQNEAISLKNVAGRCEIRLANGSTFVADQVVLALGNFPPADLQVPGKTAGSSRFVADPWSSGTLTDVALGESVLLIGSGLTSVDVTLELRARGFEGKIHILSRRGLLPQRHAAIPFPPFPIADLPRSTRGLLRLIRVEVKKVEARGSNWREVIDSLRPVTQQIWRSLPHVEQRRFLRHLRTYWDVHRHRIADRIADQLALQLRSGQIQIHAGRITEYRELQGVVDVSYRDRKTGALRILRVNRVVNCTGPDGDYRRVSSPLLSDLIAKGLVRPDELGLGLDVAENGAVIDAQGSASNSVYAIGPLRKAKLYESIAVPELRVQVAELANLLVPSLPAETNSSIPAGSEAFSFTHS
jgi:uncharacterized NAD(P)/FAD-binding protein YdhS